MRAALSDRNPHPLAGQTVRIQLHKPHPFGQVEDGDEFVVEDWWENVSGTRWTASVLGGNPAAMIYARRAVRSNRDLHEGFEPVDDVVYGKVGILGHLIHESEIVP